MVLKVGNMTQIPLQGHSVIISIYWSKWKSNPVTWKDVTVLSTFESPEECQSQPVFRSRWLIVGGLSITDKEVNFWLESLGGMQSYPLNQKHRNFQLFLFQPVMVVLFCLAFLFLPFVFWYSIACFFHPGVLTSRGWTISGAQGPCSGTSACMWLLCFPPTSCQMRVLSWPEPGKWNDMSSSQRSVLQPTMNVWPPKAKGITTPAQDSLNTSTGAGWTACLTQHLLNATRCWSPRGPLLQHSTSPEPCQLWRGQLLLGGAGLRAPGVGEPMAVKWCRGIDTVGNGISCGPRLWATGTYSLSHQVQF